MKVLNKSSSRDQLFSYLRAKNIGVNVHYIPVYRHPYFNLEIRLKGAENFYKSAITLPIYPLISQENLDIVFEKILNFYEKK